MSTSEEAWRAWLRSDTGQEFLRAGVVFEPKISAWRSFLDLPRLQKSLSTLYFLRELFQATRVFDQNPPLAHEIIDAGTQDFARAPALADFFRAGTTTAIAINGVELDAYPILVGGHSRFDIGTWIAKNLTHLQHVRAHYFAADFFMLQTSERLQAFGLNASAPALAQKGGPRRVVTVFYPFVSPHPALAWGLPAQYGDAGAWIRSMTYLLNSDDLAIVFHQGKWEEEEWDEARAAFPQLRLVARRTITCPFYPTPYPSYGSLYQFQSM